MDRVQARPDHSQPVGGAEGGPEDFSHLAGSPGVEKRFEFTGYNPVVSSAPVQERQGAGSGVEQRVPPVLGVTGSNKESQVELTLLGLPGHWGKYRKPKTLAMSACCSLGSAVEELAWKTVLGHAGTGGQAPSEGGGIVWAYNRLVILYLI